MLLTDVNVLVVDDVNTMRVQVRDILKQFGFQKVTLAASAEEAQACLKEQPYQVVLCDWHMVPTTGLDLLKFIRGNDSLKALVFLMVTAESTKELVVQAIQCGVDDYLVKPFTLAQVQSKVYGALLKKGVLQ
ncbi:MAG: response regulator [Bdellovibrionales bacterium]|nr:response regulator [Bdellovibrionales bacterium]